MVHHFKKLFIFPYFIFRKKVEEVEDDGGGGEVRHLRGVPRLTPQGRGQLVSSRQNKILYGLYLGLNDLKLL